MTDITIHLATRLVFSNSQELFSGADTLRMCICYLLANRRVWRIVDQLKSLFNNPVCGAFLEIFNLKFIIIFFKYR